MTKLDEHELHQLLFRARKRIEALEAAGIAREPVAVVGLACRLPGAPDAGTFWSNLLDGVDGVGPLTDGRWDTAALVGTGSDPVAGRMRTADGGFLSDVKSFDAAFFGISGREAASMDPQQRLLLETSWHALEDAGILPAALSGSDAGVFVGISSADYGFLQAGGPAAQEAWAGTGNALSIAANRLSYVLNLNGPSLAIDTACSSSLVAVHQAVRSLRLKETGLAIVGGVNVILNPDVSIAFSQAGMMSPTGRCRTFDASADGYVRAEGVGVVVLKRLKDAERDGDRIRAVIAGSAVNQDGRGNGLTAPNGPAQQAVIRAALKDAGAEPKDVAYVEAHGTGTPLGDPIELNNLAKVMAGREGDPVLVGAVKAAIGHTEAAAGIAGLIKTVLALEAGEIPGQLHLATLNPRLKEAAEAVVTPVRTRTRWPETHDFAGVSAFGFGGTNAHVVLKRHRRHAPVRTFEGPDAAILTLSARSATALAALAARVAASPPADPVDFAASHAARRTAHAHRLALPVRRGAADAVGPALAAFARGAESPVRAGQRLGTRPPRVVLAFSGQGSQAPGMGAALDRESPVFRATLDRLAAALADRSGIDLRALLFDTPAETLQRTENAQPAIAALQLALTADLQARGLRFDAVMGYSLGEYTAAAVAGALAEEDMLALIARRGALIGALPAGGAMLSLRAPADFVADALDGRAAVLSVAAVIGPDAVVLAGEAGAIAAVATAAAAKGFTARALKVSHAFHSPLMDPALPALGELCAAAALQPLRLPLVSNLDGATKAPGTRLEPGHWVRHSREPVAFHRSLETLAKDPTTIVLEVGPNGTLTALGRATGTLGADRFVAALPKADAGVDAVEDALAQLVALGVDLDRSALGEGTLPGSALPLMPFDRTVHWIEPVRRPGSVTTVSSSADPLQAATAALAAATAAVSDAAPGDAGDLHQLFADQLDLVRRTIASQLAALAPGEAAAGEAAAGERPAAAASASRAPSEPAPMVPDAGPAGAAREPAAPEDASASPSEPPEDGDVRMRPAAELIWLLSQKSDDASRAYHIPVLLALDGPLDPDHVTAAMARLMERHEALRAVYPAPGVMEIRPPSAVSPDVTATDGRAWTEAAREAWVAGLGDEPFDLARDRLIRVRLLRTGDQAWLLSVEAHHLVTDGLSMNVIVGELAAIVNALAAGGEPALAPALSYRDHLRRLAASRTSPAAEAGRAYWLNRLGGGAPALDLSTDRPRGGAKSYRGASVMTLVEAAEAGAVRAAARALGLTPFMLLHTLFAVALARLAGQRQVAIATPTAGRPEDLAGPLVGYCSDLIFSLVTVEAAESLEAHCRRARTDLLADLAHAGYSFGWIAEDLRESGTELPLQVVFNYQNAYVGAPFERLAVRPLPRRIGYLDGEFTLNAVDVEGRLALELVYNTGLYGEATARAVLDAVAALALAVAGGARGPVGSLPLLGTAARARLQALSRGERWPAPSEPPFRRIEAVAARRPDAIALRHGADTLTYGGLDARANALAHRLLAAGLQPEERVGIHLDRSIDLVVAELAISKAGGAFVVLDRRQPAERRRRILAQAGIRLVVGPADDLEHSPTKLKDLADERMLQAIESGAISDRPDDTVRSEGAPGMSDVRFLDPASGADEPRTAPAVRVPMSGLMYVIFTSGSTGEPKGVMIEHASVANYVAWFGRRLGLTADDRILQFAALGFDASIEEIYAALTHGAGLTLRDDPLPESPAAFWRDVAAKGITVVDLPTAFWHGLMADEAALAGLPAGLRHVVLGGEAAKPAAVARWQALAPAGVSLWNTYGPTETTIVATAVRLGDVADLGDGPTPIGTPVANAVVHVLDEAMQPLPPGAIGMLHIGGHPVLARGYLGRPDLTDAAFVALPDGGGRVYRTGDRVRWRPDGLLEYHGRADGQVKIRGFRIETAEIETVLERLPAVAAATVVAVETAGGTRLAAYVASAAGAAFDRAALRAALARELPEVMVPQAIVAVAALPLNANGKVDRKALPAVDWAAELAGPAAAAGVPLTADEAAVAAVWGEVLGLDPAALAPDSDFFAVGGDSLSAMRVLTRLGATTGAGLSARDLFRASRLGDLAALLARGGAAPAEAVPRLDRTGPLPLSAGQRRLYFLHQLDPGRGTYNLPSRIDLDGPLDMARVRAALAALVARHESLRTRFVDRDGEPRAIVEPAGELPLAVVDLADRPDADAAVAAAATALSVAPFDLAEAPLVRATLFRRGPTAHSLVLAAHHIVTDGWSMAIIARDFAAAYAADDASGDLRGLAPLERDYVDLAAATQAAGAEADTAALRAYWRGRLGDLPDVLDLPADRPRPELPNGEGRVHRFALDAATATALRDTARAIGVTPFAVLFATWGLLLARLSGQGAFAIGTVHAGRTTSGSEGVVGFFADTLALRFDAADQPDFAALCRRAQNELVEGLAHAGLPFEAIVEDLAVDRSANHPPIFQTMLVWQNTPAPVTRIGDLTLRAERLDKGATQFDLVLDMTEGDGGIEAMLEYRTQLFDPATIARLGGQFARLLGAALATPAAPVGALPFAAAAGAATSTEIPEIADLRVDAVLDLHARTRPEAVAVAFEAADGSVATLTWGAFEAAAARLAAYLQTEGVGHGDAVAIAAERSPALLTAIYAVMKAGAAYVPLDPAAPAERQRALLSASGARFLLADGALVPLFAGADGQTPVPVHRLEDPVPAVAAPVRRAYDPGLPIYVIFTSGTTGTPKGVVVPHRGVANMALGMGRVLGVGPDDSLLQFAPLNFDASALQIFVPLMAGGRSVLHHAPGRLGARDFMALAARHRLTMLDLPAALWRQWVDTMTEEGLAMAPSIRIFFTGGEALVPRTMRKWAALCDRKVAFLSSYGPTEASITATAYVSDSVAMATAGDGAPDIGHPLPNVAVHILDLFGAPAAPGTIGEIAIGGPGVADGYLGDPERTAAAFVERPGLGRVYLTGDYGRLTASGSLEFHGRRDAQIKMRGFRIEPAEVESAMLAHPGIAAALVTTQKTADRRVQLVAYAVPAGEGAALEGPAATALLAGLKAHLEARLPEAMVPSGVRLIPRLPLLPNGKIDRRALPEVEVAAPEAAPYEAPEPGPETLLAGIWAELLNVPAIGRADNFFERGGDSILSLQLAARARRAGLLFEVRDVFRHQTLAALAAAARTAGETETALVAAGGRRAPGEPLRVEDLPLATLDQAELDRIEAATGDVETIVDASFGQAGMLFHALLAPESGAFLLQTRIDFAGGLDVAALKGAVGDLVARHPVLRTGFRWEDRALPLQVVRTTVDLPWLDADVSGESDEAAAIDALSAADLSRPLDLARPPLMRLTLVRRRAGHTLVWLKHHAVVDGWSMPLLYDDLVAFYAARLTGHPPTRAPAPGFDRYIAWLRGFDRAAAERHWAEALAGFDTPTDLGIGRGASAETGAIGRAERRLDPAAFARLTAVARAERVTLGTLVMGAFSVLIARMSGQREVLSNVTVAGRPHDLPGAEAIVGMFLNALPLRAEVDDAAPLWPWLRALQDRHAANDAMGHLGLLDIQRYSGVPTGQRLAETLVIVQNTPLGSAMTAGAAAGGIAGLVTGVTGLQRTSAPVTLFAEEEGQELLLALQYDDGRYGADEMETLADRLALIVTAMADAAALGDLRLMSPAEEAAVIARSAGPTVPPPDASSLIARFETQAAATPKAVALIGTDGTVTYATLDERAARIGTALVAAGVRPGDVVAVFATRSPDTTAALLGILKAGAAFLALDPTYPEARLAYVMEDSGAVLLLHAGDLPEGLAAVAPQRLTVAVALAAEPGPTPGAAVLTPESLAYLIYTSGSTGQPKGVRALHRGALARLAFAERAMPYAPGEVAVQKTALSFVDCIAEIFGPLVAGVPALVLSEDTARDVPALVEALGRHRVSRLILVPTLLRAMLDLHPALGERLPALTHWISSGEALSADLVADVRRAAPGARLINLYGSSEVAGDVTWFDTAEMPADAGRPASLGRPMDNTAVYLLDGAGRPVPDGLPGELFIGGAHVAAGYHGRPDLSADAFLPNPFGPGLLFRSRDWGRREADGTITFLGRQDGQVKIRGMRVDLAEVDAALKALPTVARAVVLNRPGADKRPRIVAWYVGTAETAEIRASLEARLPRHMVPSALMRLDAVPLLPNGKVDRRALPDPQTEALADGGPVEPPRTASEAALVRIVADVLDLPPDTIGRSANFFQLGGDSILAIRVATRAAGAGLTIAVRDLFETDGIADLAARADAAARPALEDVALGAGFPLIAPMEGRRVRIALDPPRPEASVRAAIRVLAARHAMLGGWLTRRDGGVVLGFGTMPATGAVPVFAADVEAEDGTAVALALAAHPMLVDAAGWAVIAADLGTLLSGGTPAGPAPSPTALPPAPVETPVTLAPAVADWPDLDVGDLLAAAAANLRLTPAELIAAALVAAGGAVPLGGPVGFVVADRPAGSAGVVAARERVTGLSASAGDLGADILAAKAALRGGDADPAAGARLTVRLVGGPAFAAATIGAGLLPLPAPDAAHVEMTLAGGILSAAIHGGDAAVLAAFGQAFGVALGQLADRAAARDPVVWTETDFPLAALKPGAARALAGQGGDVATVLAATPGQTGMLFHTLADPESAVYGIHTTVRLKAGIDPAVLQGALDDLVARHAILRTRFDWTLGEAPVQVVAPTGSARLTRLDWRGLTAEAYAERLAAAIADDRMRPVDLSAAPAMRASLALAPDGSADLLLALHHAVVDGWSLPLLLRDLMAFYDGRLGLPAPALPAAPDFADHVAWIAGEDRAAATRHWRASLGTLTAGTDLVIGRGTDAETGVYATTSLTIPPAVLEPLARRARAAGVTLGSVVQGAWGVLLARLNQAEEQVFGVTVSGRPAGLPGIEAAVGPFVNVLPLRIATRDDVRLTDYLRAVQDTHARNDRFNHLAFAEIQALSALPAGERLADSMIVFQNFPLDGGMVASLGGGAATGLAGLIAGIDGHQTTSYALTLFAVPAGEGLQVDVVFDAGRFDGAAIDGLARALRRVFETMAEATTVGDVGILSAAEEAALVALGRGPDVPAPTAASVLALFEARADRQPDATALIHEGHAVSYAEIEAAANLLAADLRARGVGRGAVVAVHMERSPLLVTALVAILKAGAAWLPLDPAYPPARLAFMLEDGGAALVLTDGGPLAVDPACPVVDAGERLALLAAGDPAPRLPSALTPGDLAYLIYTSGSTGQPKGVRALHRGLLNRLAWSAAAYPYGPDEIAVLKTALPFVDSVAEIFGPLTAGVPTVVVPADDVADVLRLIELLERHRVTWIVLVPSLLRAILELPDAVRGRLAALRTIVVSGEACTAELVAATRAGLPGVRLVNLYGSSEVAGDVTAFDTAAMDVGDPRAPVPIGRPIDRSATYILDRRLRPVPVGLPGELYVAGDNLADGYHGRPDLTAEAFRPDPFGAGPMFRTKDWARWNADGAIEFLGRQDGQIKIRGMRVEIGEVEAVLRSQPGVEDAVVRAVPAAGGGLALAAYWAGEADEASLAAGLKARLAGHMVPQHWTRLAALPLLPNGKIDRRGLPDPARSAQPGGADARPDGLIERLLVPVWSDVLGEPEAAVPVTEDFFALGGHSLAAAKALAEIAERTGVTLRLRQFYGASTLRDVAASIEADLVGSVPIEELNALIEEARREASGETAR